MKEKKYPKLLFESNKIKVIRQEVQKDFEKDELVAFYILRPFSIYMSLPIVKYTNISANNITFLMMILSFIFPAILFFTETLTKVLILGPFFFYSLYFLDLIDGEIARLKKTTSELGKFYDASLWFTLPVLFYYLCI